MTSSCSNFFSGAAKAASPRILLTRNPAITYFIYLFVLVFLLQIRLEGREGRGNYRIISARKITDGPGQGSDADTVVVQPKGGSYLHPASTSAISILQIWCTHGHVQFYLLTLA